MKLFYTPGTGSLAPHIALREAGLDFQLERVSLRTKTTESGEDFHGINPHGYVPVLQLDDGGHLTEGPAILQFLADLAPSRNLAPANGTLERYRLQELLSFIATELHKNFAVLVDEAYPEEGKRMAHERLARRLRSMEARLASQPHLMGTDFTVADAYLFTVLSWCAYLQVDLSPFPALRSFQARVMERPQVQATLKAEGLLKS
ncbi:glutathione transferase GstA [Comamonas sp. JC664]|uniref:glutathione transferase GstA n=1 Tax=Comamonas sp. JC664 TaxID=2801917 RepID=UPI00174B0EA6|nr:glutathione transferase GstA [Comamonas sp. JC664]MBL0696306.1 glutathione transferase GstA [Comamonas sp. JC664]GHG66382.1 glutathione S-transferase [Comamonas sp. KCTC 72670]